MFICALCVMSIRIMHFCGMLIENACIPAMSVSCLHFCGTQILWFMYVIGQFCLFKCD
jgi:hypothetical protein